MEIELRTRAEFIEEIRRLRRRNQGLAWGTPSGDCSEPWGAGAGSPSQAWLPPAESQA